MSGIDQIFQGIHQVLSDPVIQLGVTTGVSAFLARRSDAKKYDLWHILAQQ